MTKQQWTLLGGVGLGAGLMFLLDPDRGRRRRALVRDKAVRSLNVTGEALRKTGKDLGNRTRGVAAEVHGRLRRDDSPNEVLGARVRARLGHAVSHPGAIDVAVWNGCVVLTGAVLAEELDGLLSAVQKVRGVEAIENRLEVHQGPEGVPALQGGRPRPAARGRVGAALGALGLGLLARGLNKRDAKRSAQPGSDAREPRPESPVTTTAAGETAAAHPDTSHEAPQP
ncbi:MAG TPA: BON domain-containing protein [Thermoanaerobaculia bacterium]|nr:BON domain-containing protein [Thermoanaerobaculia bacterium]